jgi:large subunit ribosomal protein L9
MSVVAEALMKIQLSFGARAGETGKLYGSITSQEIVDTIQQKTGYAIKRQQLDMQPLRTLGEHTIHVRLTMDLIPEIKVTVYREGEAEPELAVEEAVAEPETEAVVNEPQAESMPEEPPVEEMPEETGESEPPAEA